MVWEAYQKVKSNKGSAGVDGVSLAAFELGLEKHLYKIWNRLTSGSYYPQAVREVEIPKKDGRVRKLGIPTESDRIAQQVIKSYLEPRLEKVFHTSSYGYRPKCSAHQAIEAVRANVRKYAWVIDMDIKGFFDEMDHELLLKAVEKHAEEMGEDVHKKVAGNADRGQSRPLVSEGRQRDTSGRCYNFTYTPTNIEFAKRLKIKRGKF
jgi:group II intron reverse transcriptase/maturase